MYMPLFRSPCTLVRRRSRTQSTRRCATGSPHAVSLCLSLSILIECNHLCVCVYFLYFSISHIIQLKPQQQIAGVNPGFFSSVQIPVHSGSATLKDAINEAMRDWVTNVTTTHYLIGSAIGPHPFPTIVRDFQVCNLHREICVYIY